MKKTVLLLLIIHLSVVLMAFWSPPNKWDKIAKTEDQVFFHQNCRSSQWIDLIIQTDSSLDPEKCMMQISKEIPYNQRYIYRKAYQGVAIRIRLYHISMLLDLPFIHQVFFCRDSFIPVRNLASISVKADHVWKQLDNKTTTITGNEIKVGMIDTGIDPLHKEFAPTGIGSTSKIKVAKNIVDPDVPMDDLAIYPHGTHVGGIIAGKNPDDTTKKGIAPDASLYVFRVFGKNGSLTLPDILAGIEEAILNDIDVLNISLGFSSKNPIPSIIEGDPFYEAIQNGIRKGIVICSAAGNDGVRHKDNPWPLLAPGLFDKVIQPSASDDRMSQIVSIEWNQKTICTINTLLSPHSPPFTKDMSDTPVVDCNYGSAEDFKNLSVKGKIALIARGPKDKPISFSEKNLNAKRAGAIGCVLYNFEDSVIDSSLLSLHTDDQECIPNIGVSGNFAARLKKYLQLGAHLMFQDQDNAVIADFSSAGPCGSADQNIFKPDLCFPGKQINSSVKTYVDDNHVLIHPYADWDGTSMSTAGTSGCVALLKQAHPNWTPEEIKAACMNNADLLINPISKEPFPFFNQGAGQLNIYQSLNTPAVITPPSFMHNIKDKESISLPFMLKNQTNKTIFCSYAIEFFHLKNQSESSPFKLVTKNSPTMISPQVSFDETLQINFDKNLTQNMYEGVLWVSIQNQNEGDIIAKLHIPIILFQNSFAPTSPVIEKISLSPNRITPGIVCNLAYRLHAGSCLDINQSLTFLQHAQQIRIVAEDNHHNVYQEIFYGENLFVGDYLAQWDGNDFEGKPIFPDGLYHLVAEISGFKANRQKSESIVHRYPLGDFTVTQSSLPNTPLLILSAVPRVTLYETFVIDLILLHSNEVKSIDLNIKFSKNSLSPISYTIHDGYIDLDTNSDIAFDTDTITIKATFNNQLPKKITIASFLFRAEKATNQKDGVYINIENCTMIGNDQKELRCNEFRPVITIDKSSVMLGDFNQDNIVDKQDYEMLLCHISEEYLSENWNPQFDLNNDLHIDVNDVFILSKYYAE